MGLGDQGELPREGGLYENYKEDHLENHQPSTNVGR